jgi:hypothetical protein|tara:strand:+ start:37 stop:480 length:444 start_codon:yes stop_codon:yes gene_type:complete
MSMLIAIQHIYQFFLELVMSKFSDYLEEKILDATLKGGTFPTISSAHLAVFIGDPTDTGSGGAEGSWTNYARQAIAFGTISGGAVDNSAQVQFPALVGSNVTISHIGIFDAASSGNLLYHTALASSKTLTADDVLSFAINGVTVTLA